jgi:outer membrane murein-binding lipoprotein Lpp
MARKLFLLLITVTVLFTLVLSGCATTGISKAQYDQVAAQLADAQSKLAAAQADLAKAQTDKAAAEKQVKDLQAQVASLQSQVSTLKGQTTLTGTTLAETAAKIVKNYDETHVYSTFDLFICSDMASEVWNMLKAQGINAVVVVGNKDAVINDILQSNHAWVLATVDNNELLALEATSGRVYKKTEKPYYYIGWSFKSPADLKSYNDWVKEYNTRVVFRNQLNTEANKAFSSGNDALYAKLVELRSAQETELNGIMARIKALATQIY